MSSGLNQIRVIKGAAITRGSKSVAKTEADCAKIQNDELRIILNDIIRRAEGLMRRLEQAQELINR